MRSRSPHRKGELAARPVPPPTSRRVGHRVLSVLRTALLLLAVTTVYLGALELILAAAGISPIVEETDPYVGFSSQIPLFVQESGPNGEETMVTAANKLDLFNMQRFPAKKTTGTYRIFCMGGSTTYGRPYDNATSFCGWLRAVLPKADPARRWEVINAGGISYASYRVRMLMEELVQYEPDLFIIYTGHNEFLERRTYGPIMDMPVWLREAGTALHHTRTYTVLTRIASWAGRGPAPREDARPSLPGEVDAILDETLGPESYHRDDAQRDRVLTHFRYSLGRMTDLARSAGAEVVFITPASNLRHCSPFKSEHQDALSDDAREQCDAFLADATEARQAGRVDEALAAVEQALALDDRYAHLHFVYGQVLCDLERYDEARAAFVRARDEDICPLRALTPIRGIIADTARARRVPCVDFAALAERRSPHGIPGEELFVDHVHPTIKGHRLLALAVLDALMEQGIVRPADAWNAESMTAVTREVEGSIDARAGAMGLRNQAKVLNWAGKFAEARRLALRAIELNTEDAEAYYQAARGAVGIGRSEEAITYYRQAVAAKPDYALARFRLANALLAKDASEEAIEHYRRLLDGPPEYAALAHNNLGNELSAQGALDEAIRHYREALNIRPGYVDAHSNLGLCLMARGDAEEAIREYEKALALDPDSAPTHYNLGRALLAQGRPREAAEHLRETLRSMPDSSSVHYSLGEALRQVGDVDEAEKHFRAAARGD